MAAERPVFHVSVETGDGAGLHWLYSEAEVLDHRDDDEGRVQVAVRIAPEKEPRLVRRFPSARRMR